MALSKILPASQDQSVDAANVIINGAMEIAQRGSSFSNIAADTYVVDRFFVSHGSVTPDVSQQTVTVGGETGLPVQFTKYARCDFNVSGGANLGIATRLEDTEKYVGTYKLSFYAKGTNPTGGQMAVRFIQRFGSGGSSQVIVDPTSPTFTLTSTWQRFEIDVELPSVSGKTLGSGRYLQLQITQPNGDAGTGTFTLDITGVCLNVGEQAPANYPHRSYGDELAKCLRYYNSVGGGAPYQHFGVGVTDTTNRGESNFLFPVEMRAAPSISVSSSSHFRVGVGSNYAATGFSTDQTCSQSSRLLFNVSSGVSSGNATVISANNTTDARLKIDAEL